jgi:hypothetical protein
MRRSAARRHAAHAGRRGAQSEPLGPVLHAHPPGRVGAGAQGLPARFEEGFDQRDTGGIIASAPHCVRHRQPVGVQHGLRRHEAIDEGRGVQPGEGLHCIGQQHQHHAVPLGRVARARGLREGPAEVDRRQALRGTVGVQHLSVTVEAPAQRAQRRGREMVVMPCSRPVAADAQGAARHHGADALAQREAREPQLRGCSVQCGPCGLRRRCEMGHGGSVGRRKQAQPSSRGSPGAVVNVQDGSWPVVVGLPP